MSFGIVQAAQAVGLSLVVIKPKRAIGAFEAQVVIEETHHDELEITDHPIEQGASISDHAFKRPAEVTIRCGWSDSPASNLPNVIGNLAVFAGSAVSQVRDIYQKLLNLQQQRIPFDVYTGKRYYQNMLIKTLSTTTNKQTENSLVITAVLRQVILVTTQTVTVSTPAANQTDPQTTQPTANAGSVSLKPAPNFNSGPPSL